MNGTTENIYSLDSLRNACSSGRAFNLVIFYGYKQEDINRITIGCLSQFFPINFTDEDGVIYSSLHQYKFAQKAKLFNDIECYQKIMKTTNINEISQYGIKIRNFDQNRWNQSKDQISYQGNLHKFSQNPALKQFLLSFSRDTIFVSADPCDDYWGTKMSLDDPQILNPFEWKGYNKHGFQLTLLRDFFLRSPSHPTAKRRDYPIYFLTDIHMNEGPLNGIVTLTDGIVAINGDIVLGVKFLYEKGILGSANTHSIEKVAKFTWTDPQQAIEILSKRKSSYPIIIGFGNHEVNKQAYENSSTTIQGFIVSLKEINAIPLCTYPDYSFQSPDQYRRHGAYRSFKINTVYFFSYITSNMVKFSRKKITREQHENEGIFEISNQILNDCDENTLEIFLLLHADFDEAGKIAAGIVQNLGKIQSQGKLKFDLMDVHVTFCCGHEHGNSVNSEYRIDGKYWKGKFTVDVLNRQKNVRCIYPNCADDCIRINPNNERDLYARFTTGRI